MGEGGERETGENQRSTKVRGKVREVNKPPPTAIKKTPPAGKSQGKAQGKTTQAGKARGQ